MSAWDITVAGLVGIQLLDDGLGDLGASGCQRAVTGAEPRSAAASRSFRNNLDLVRNGILSALRVGVGAGDFAVAGLVVDTLDTCHWNGRSGIGPGSFALLEAAFGGV
jgi:hypothetical protein